MAEVSESVPPDLVGTTLGDRFRLDARLGAGGFGVVYRAWDRQEAREVAIKVLREELYARPSLRRRFEREAHALISLSHPNIVAIIDVGVAGATPFIAMELLKGRDLGQLLKAHGPLDEDRASHITDELLAGIGHMHARGLVHRDLKPANVFLQALPGGDERVKLLDFGLAKFLDVSGGGELPSLTKTGEVFGTPGYMPPEQLVSERLDHRADLYSAVVIVFQMLAGRRPFEGEAHEVLRRVLVEAPPSLGSLRPGVTVQRELEAWLQAGMAKDRSARADSAEGLRASFSALPRPLLTGPGAAGSRLESQSAPPEQRSHRGTSAHEQPAEHGTHAASKPRRRGLGARISGLVRRLVLASATLVSFLSVLAIGSGLLVIFVLKWGSPEGRDGPGLTTPEPAPVAAPQPAPVAARSASTTESPTSSNSSSLTNASSSATAPTGPASTMEGFVTPAPPMDAGAGDAGRASDAGTQSPRDAGSRDASPAWETGTVALGPVATDKPSATRAAWPAKDPFRRRLPRELAKARRAIERGDKGDDRMLATLRNYNRAHPEDARGNLLLARLYLNRRWHRDAVRQYGFAVGRDPGARGDRRMLNDLIVLVESSKLANEAAALITKVYGAEAQSAVGAALTAATRAGHDGAVRRLSTLQRDLGKAVAADPATAE